MTSFGVRVNQKQWLQEFMFITEVVRLGVDRPGDSNFSFTDDERRTLVDAAMAMGKDLMEQVVTIVMRVPIRTCSSIGVLEYFRAV